MNRREIEATVRNLPHWFPCPIWIPEIAALEMTRQANGWFDCPPNAILVFRQYCLPANMY